MRGSVVFALMWIGACGSQPPKEVAPAPAPTPSEAARKGPAPKEPVATMFGLVEDGTYRRTKRIELVEESVYGWRIKLPCTGPTLFRETLQLPAAKEWSIDPGAKHIQVSTDQRRAVTEDYSGCYDGWIQHTWMIEPDDPAGEYVLTVEVDGYRRQTFRGRFYRAE